MGCINPNQVIILDAVINNDIDKDDCSFSPPITTITKNSNNLIASPSLATITDYFPSVTMLNEINSVRADPMKYIDKIIELQNKIKSTENQKYLALDEHNIQIKLYDGLIAFESCIDFLKKIKPLPALIMKEELKIPFPTNTPEICTTKDYIKNITLFKTSEFGTQFKNLEFHYDICPPNPQLSVLLQIIDDTKSKYQRRKNIFSSKAKNIGINNGVINEHVTCYYLMFSE